MFAAGNGAAAAGGAVVQSSMGGSLTLVGGRVDMWCLLLPGLGALSTVALASYLKASRLLPIALFGILGYVEPVLLVLVSDDVARRDA